MTIRPLAALAVAVIGHLSLGRGVEWAALTQGDPFAWKVMWELRLPRVLAGLGAGACLGVSGVLIQRILRNPLASPELTAVNPAAVLAILLGLAFGWVDSAHLLEMSLAAFVGGLLGGAVMWLAARGRGPAEMAIIGVLASMALGGATMIAVSSQALGLAGVLRWLIGGLDAIVGSGLVVLLPSALAGVLVAWLAANPIDIVAAGDRHGHSTGVPPDLWRGVALLIATWLAAAAVAVTGPLAFVGFMAPHLHTHWCGGGPLRGVLARVAVLGALFVVVCDAASIALSLLIQSTGSGQQVGVPTGAVTCVLGAVALGRLVSRPEEGALAVRSPVRKGS